MAPGTVSPFPFSNPTEDVELTNENGAHLALALGGDLHLGKH